MKQNLLSKYMVRFAGIVAAVALFNGCGDSKSGHSHDGDHGHSHGTRPSHDKTLPHGGTPVLVAEDKFHLELVLDATGGKMQAYVLDGHLEGYVQVPETNFALIAKSSGSTEQLTFQRAPEPGSANVPEKSSLFESQAEWLKTAKTFEGNIPTLTLNGNTFTNILFSFPKGTRHVH